MIFTTILCYVSYSWRVDYSISTLHKSACFYTYKHLDVRLLQRPLSVLAVISVFLPRTMERLRDTHGYPVS